MLIQITASYHEKHIQTFFVKFHMARVATFPDSMNYLQVPISDRFPS